MSTENNDVPMVNNTENVEPTNVKPDAVVEQPKADAPKSEPQSGDKRPAQEVPEGTPPAKKQKSADIKKQIEYYLSDLNLSHDKMFHKSMSDNDGWLELELIMNCNKIKAMNCTTADICEALAGGSTVEVDSGKTKVRREGNKPLPALQEKKKFQKKPKPERDEHKGGVVGKIRTIPEGLNELKVKQALAEALATQKIIKKLNTSNTWVCRNNVTNELYFSFYVNPDLTVESLTDFKFKIEETELTLEIPTSEEAKTKICPFFPEHIQKKRLKAAGKNKDIDNRYATPVELGGQKFPSDSVLRQRVKRIQISRSNGEELQAGSGDFLLMMDLIKYHPDKKKIAGVKGIKVDLWDATKNDTSTAFHIIREDGTTDDISVVKCLQAVKENAKKAGEQAAAAKPAQKDKEDEAKEHKADSAPKVEEKKAESTGAEKKEEATVEEKKVESTGEEKKEESTAEEKKEEPKEAPKE